MIAALILSLAAAMLVAPAASSPQEEPCLNPHSTGSVSAGPSRVAKKATPAASASSAATPRRKLGRIKPEEQAYPCGELAPIRTTVEAIFPPVAQIEPEPQFTPVPPEPTAFETLSQGQTDDETLAETEASPSPSTRLPGELGTTPCDCFAGGPIAFYPVPVGGGVFVPPQVTPITTPVPEPHILSLLLAGALLLLWRRA